jgi:hypothetical protein
MTPKNTYLFRTVERNKTMKPVVFRLQNNFYKSAIYWNCAEMHLYRRGKNGGGC